MKKTAAILAVAALGLGCVYGLLRLNDHEPHRSLTLPSTVLQEHVLDAESIFESTAEVDLPPQKTEGISGWVVSIDGGIPVSNASVMVSWREGKIRREAGSVTDENGVFHVAGNGTGDYTVEVSHSVFVSEKRRYRVSVTDDEPLALVEISMVFGGVVSGRVFDAVTDAGIAGVEIGIGRRKKPGAVTDELGRYRIGGVAGGNKRVYYVKAKGYQFPVTHANGLKVSVVLGEELTDVDIALQPGVFVAIQGIVVDESGSRVEGAEVTASRMYDSLMGRSAVEDVTVADGSFLLDDLEVADDYFVNARIAGYLSEETGPLPLTAEGIADLVLTIRPTSSISGKVVDLDGDPISDSAIQVASTGRFRGTNSVGLHPTSLGKNGEFLMENLSAGSYGLIVQTSTYWNSGIVRPQITVELGSGDHVEGIRLTFPYARHVERLKSIQSQKAARSQVQQIVNRAEIELSGQVLQASTGEPLKDFTLRTEGPAMMSFRIEVIHDEEGRFSATKREGLDLTITVSAAGFSPGWVVVGDGDAQRPVVVRLRKGAVVEGEVVEGSGKAIAGASIHIAVDPSVMDQSFPLPGMRPPDAVSLVDGLFRLDTLSDSPEDLFVTHPAFAMGSKRVFPTRSGVTKTMIVLSKGGIVEGRVRKGGHGVRGRSIMVLNAAGKNLQLSPMSTDVEGYYRYEHLLPGRYTLYTSLGDDVRWVQHRDAEIEEGGVTVVDFDFSGALSTLEGIVWVDGVPRRSTIRVEIVTAFAKDLFNVQSDAAGEYFIQDLPAGVAEVSVSALDDEGTRYSETFSFVVEEGSTMRRDFELGSGR